MTIKDQSHADDADLELFLQGRDELSHKLKGLRQPKTSPAMDDAILAIIEAELANEAMPAQAANDPVTPESVNAVRPRFLSRWQISLGLAAGVLLTVLLQMHRQSDQAPVLVAQAPQAVEPALPAEKNKPVELRAPIAPPAGIIADAGTPSTPPVASKPHEKPVHRPVPKHESRALAKTSSAPIVIAQADTEQQVVVTGIRASLQQSLSVKRHAAQNVEVVTAEDVGKMPDKNVADSLQRVPGVTIHSASEEDPRASALEQMRAATNHIEVINGDSLGSGSSNKENPVAFNSPEHNRPVAEPAPAVAARAAVPAAISAPVAEDPAKAKAWLDVIAEKLKAGLNRDALDEWTKFRKAYPSYPVPESIAEKIKALPKP